MHPFKLSHFEDESFVRHRNTYFIYIGQLQYFGLWSSNILLADVGRTRASLSTGVYFIRLQMMGKVLRAMAT